MNKQIPWTDVVMDTRDYTVYQDGYPVTEGHILFVPKTETWEHLEKYNERYMFSLRCLMFLLPKMTYSRM